MALKKKKIDPRNVFYYDGAKFVFDWSAFDVGASVFIPSPHPRQLRSFFMSLADKQHMIVFGRIVIENGMYGVRFWRSA
jgi:hypothetical protein